jgi:hypothetical protein
MSTFQELRQRQKVASRAAEIVRVPGEHHRTDHRTGWGRRPAAGAIVYAV